MNNRHCFQLDDVRRVVAFIINYAEKNAVFLPGRVATQVRINVQLLPLSTSKAEVFRLYQESAKSACFFRFNLHKMLSELVVCSWITITKYTHV